MTQPSGVDARRCEPPTGADWRRPDRRRTLQLVLATVWLIDAVLQLQPFMFSRSFGTLMLGPTAQGNPGLIAHPITDVSRSIGNHPVGTNAAFVLVQLLIAFAIANRRTVRIGLVGSVLWSLAVWWLGEGLGGVLVGASPLTGAPGAVILYGALSVLLWPADDTGSPFVAARPLGTAAARCIWVVLWGSLAVIAFFGSLTRHPGQLFAGLDNGEPGWIVDLNHHVLSLTSHHGTTLAVVVGVVLLAVAAAPLLPLPVARALTCAAIAFSLGLWLLGEDLGQLFTGSATDPNTGPLLVLFALAYWPLRRRQAPASSGEVARHATAVAP